MVVEFQVQSLSQEDFDKIMKAYEYKYKSVDEVIQAEWNKKDTMCARKLKW